MHNACEDRDPGKGVRRTFGGALQRFGQVYVVDDVGLDPIAPPLDLRTPSRMRVSSTPGRMSSLTDAHSTHDNACGG